MQTLIHLLIYPCPPLKTSDLRKFLGQALKEWRLAIFGRQRIPSSQVFMTEVFFLATPVVLHARARKLWMTGLGVNQDTTARSFLVMQTDQEQNQDKPPILCRSLYHPRAVHHLVAESC